MIILIIEKRGIVEVPRIGIDKETLDDLNILNRQKDLEEYYTLNPSHKKTIEEDSNGDFIDVDLDYLSDKRIEINAVMKEVGRERFWQWIVSKLKDLFHVLLELCAYQRPKYKSTILTWIIRR